MKILVDMNTKRGQIYMFIKSAVTVQLRNTVQW